MKYEYTQIYLSFKDSTNHLTELNSFGQERWEAVSAVKVDEHNIMYLFKREIIHKKLLNEQLEKVNI